MSERSFTKWANEPVQATEPCRPPIEEEAKRLTREEKVKRNLHTAILDHCKEFGMYQLGELGLGNALGRLTMELDYIKEQWEELEKRMKKEKKKSKK